MKSNLKQEADAGRLKAEMSVLANEYTNYYKPTKKTLKKHNILKKLRNNKDIVITRPDKGEGAIILNKIDYDKLINDILSDNTKFKLLNKDPTINREWKLQSFLLKLKKKGAFNEDDYKNLYPVGSNMARIYGLPKIHKLENMVIRRDAVGCGRALAAKSRSGRF